MMFCLISLSSLWLSKPMSMNQGLVLYQFSSDGHVLGYIIGDITSAGSIGVAARRAMRRWKVPNDHVMQLVQSISKDGMQEQPRPVVYTIILILSHGNGQELEKMALCVGRNFSVCLVGRFGKKTRQTRRKIPNLGHRQH